MAEPFTVHGIPIPSDVPRQPCPTCRRGCGCDPSKGEACQHYGCWGRKEDGTCPGIVYEIARFEAERAHRGAVLRLHAIRASAHRQAYARAVAQATDRARLEVAARIAEQTSHHPA